MTKEQEQKLKQMKKPGVFRQGIRGCEARLYEISGYRPGDRFLNDQGEPAPEHILRIAAIDLPEVMDHMRRREPKFDIRSVRLTHMIVMLSGTPYN